MTHTDITPLHYIEAGRTERDQLAFLTPTDNESLYDAFIAYCEFMRERRVCISERITKTGEDVSLYTNIPMILENFWLFTGLRRKQWEDMAANVETASMCVLINDAINGQQLEGAIIGVYTTKMITILQQRAERHELSGKLGLEQITGMTIE